MIAAERETIVTTSDADDVVRVWTAQRKEITRLRRAAAATEVASGEYDGHPWAEFTIPADRWSAAGGIKHQRKPLTAEQRAAATERLAVARQIR